MVLANSGDSPRSPINRTVKTALTDDVGVTFKTHSALTPLGKHDAATVSLTKIRNGSEEAKVPWENESKATSPATAPVGSILKTRLTSYADSLMELAVSLEEEIVKSPCNVSALEMDHKNVKIKNWDHIVLV